VEGWSGRSLLHYEVQPAAWTLIAGAILIVGICFANSLPNGFILDDYQIVNVNPAIRSIAPLQLLKTPYWGEKSDSGIYRPLTIFSYSLEYPLWHRWAGGYRLTNWLLHAINGLLVFVLARALLQANAAAYAAAALYLAHPVHTEPVVGLAGRSELLAAMFFLSAWILFRRNQLTLCVAAFCLALLSKENAIAFPPVAALEIFVFQDGWRGVLRQWKKLSAVAVVALLYLGVRTWVLGGIGVPKGGQYLEGSLTLAQRELTTGRAFLKYFQLLIAPVQVTGDYDFNSIPVAAMNDAVAWAGLLLVIATLAFALWMLKRQPALSFAILFFYATIFPTSNWIMPTAILMSERGLYLPSLAICLIGALLWTSVQTAQIRRLLAAGVMTIAVVLCIAHNYVWREELTYYGNLVRVLPNNVRGRQGYGVALVEAGRPHEAREQFEAGLKVRRDAPLLIGLAEAFMQIDAGCSRARPVLEEALKIQPSDPFGPWLLGGCLEREGFVHQAEASYRRAIDNTQFPDPKLLAAWGRTLERTGRPAEAQEAYRRAAMLN